MTTFRRREFLTAAGVSLGLGAATLSSTLTSRRPAAPRSTPGDEAPVFDPSKWASVRAQFPLTHDFIHMATFLLASHPAPVAAAIDAHRRGLDSNPADYWRDRFQTIEGSIRTAVATYTGGSGNDIALTDSTTMGLGLVYNSIRLEPGDQVIIGAHGHYSTLEACRYRSIRDDVDAIPVPFYENSATTSVDEIVTRMRSAITERTRVLAATWVHSSTGVKMPIRAMADAIAEINANRDPADRVLFCVDGVHGFGNQADRVVDLGCDVFVAGTHKWMFGPRGTGIIWATPEAWERLTPIIPSFGPNVGAWLGRLGYDQVPVGSMMTPGGFHSFEHRWALPEAFAFHQQIGMDRVHTRVTELNTRCKDGLAEIDGVTILTPMAPALSAGIICFEIEGVQPGDYVDAMHDAGIIASSSPYRESYPRLAPGILNSEEDVDRSVAMVRKIAG